MATVEWAVIRCMDWRLNVWLQKILITLGIPENHDLISVPGGPQDLLDLEQKGASGLFETLLNISEILHNVTKVLLVQHTDCGAYGGRVKCGGTEDADREFHLGQLQQAWAIMRKHAPQFQIRMVLLHIRDSGDVEFEEVVPFE